MSSKPWLRLNCLRGQSSARIALGQLGALGNPAWEGPCSFSSPLINTEKEEVKPCFRAQPLQLSWLDGR